MFLVDLHKGTNKLDYYKSKDQASHKPHTHTHTQQLKLTFLHYQQCTNQTLAQNVNWQLINSFIQLFLRFSFISLLAKAKIKQKGKVPLGEMACSIQKLSQEQLILRFDFCTLHCALRVWILAQERLRELAYPGEVRNVAGSSRVLHGFVIVDTGAASSRALHGFVIVDTGAASSSMGS